MWNLQHIIFIWRQRYLQTFKSALVYLIIDKLDDIVDKYNNTYYTTTKMKPADVKSNTKIEFSWEINDKNPKFKIGDTVRISKCKNVFAKGCTPEWSEEVFVIRKFKKTLPWTYVINDLTGEEIVGTFYKNKLRKNKSKRM